MRFAAFALAPQRINAEVLRDGRSKLARAHFIARLRTETDTGLKDCSVYVLDQGQTDLKQRSIASVSDDTLKTVYTQIEEDRKTMRYGMVKMSLKV